MKRDSDHTCEADNYKNSETLVEKLRPKLKPSDNIWNDLGVARNNEEVLIREQGYKDFAFNTLVSARIGLTRSVPDTRHKECQKQVLKLLEVCLIFLAYKAGFFWDITLEHFWFWA